MKFSEAMLEGFKRVGFRQFCGDFCPAADNPEHPSAVCVFGAANLAMNDSARNESLTISGEGWKFYKEWGFFPEELNDGDEENPSLPWEHIYGMAVAAGL